MRSYFLSEFRRDLSDLNNHVSHYVFVWQQFDIDNKENLLKFSNGFTTEFFQGNQFAKQFNVKLSHIQQFHDRTLNFILSSLFLRIYSGFEFYARSFYEFARKANNNLPDLQVRERVPNSIFNHLGLETANVFRDVEMQAFDYLRLRRNRLLHSGGKSKGELADLIRNKGAFLQRYWTNELKAGLRALNFQSDQIDQFDLVEVVDLINIFRNLSTKIDNAICKKIGLNDIVSNLLVEYYSTDGYDALIKRIGKNRAKTKFKSFCKARFDIVLTDEYLANFELDSRVA